MTPTVFPHKYATKKTMSKKLSPKMQKHLNQYLTEFNSNILQQKVTNSDSSPGSLYSIILGEIENSQLVESRLNSFDEEEKKELKDYLQNQIEKIENQAKLSSYLNYALFVSLIVLILSISYFPSPSYGTGNLLLLIVTASITWLLFSQKKRLKLKLEYELLLTYLS